MNYYIGLALSILFSVQFANASCQKDFNQFISISNAYTNYNTKLSLKYPEFKTLIKDPEKFVDKTKESFQLQRRAFPDSPLKFNFSELGIPLFKKMSASIEKEIQTINNQELGFIDKIFRQEGSLKNRELRIKYLLFLKNLIDESLENNIVTYKDALEYSLFFSRIVNYKGENQSLNPVLKISSAVFRKGIGSPEALPLEKEFEMFIKRNQRLYTSGDLIFERTPGYKDYRKAREYYLQILDDPNDLNVLILPHFGHIEEDILLHLSPYDIRIVGVTDEVIAADGVIMAPGAFWYHDISHDMLKRYKHDKYFKKLTLEQKRLITLKSYEWRNELDHFINSFENPTDQKILRFVDWVIHHDLGNFHVPSLYLSKHPPALTWQLYLGMIINGQRKDFGINAIFKILKAYKDLKGFWLNHLEEEMIISNGVKYPLEVLR